MIGSIGGDKNQLDAVESVRRASGHTAKPIRLDIVGDGSTDDVADLLGAIRKANLSDIVTFHGHKNDVGPLLSDSDALLMCSRNEAFGRVTVEALQAGVPVIGYDCGGTSELLSSPRSGGLLVGPTPLQMARAIASLGSDIATLTRLKEDAWAAGTAMARESNASRFLNEVEGVVRGDEGNRPRQP
jgi:glycosyltransferase involved in cell wall biosynthesis